MYNGYSQFCMLINRPFIKNPILIWTLWV